MSSSLLNSISTGVVLIVLSVTSSARDTLFQNSFEQEGFGGPEFIYTELNSQNALIIGGKGAGLWGNDLYAFSLGMAGYATPGRLQLDASRDFSLAYGGVTIGYSRNPGNLIHWESEALLGGGVVWTTDNTTASALETGGILVLELSVGAEVNLTDHLQVGLGTNWRMISNPQVSGLTGQALSGLGLRLSIEFGRFD